KARADGLGLGPLPMGRPRGGSSGEVVKMSALRLVQLERTAEGLEDLFGDASQVPSLEPGVVLNAHPGQRGHLGAAQSGDAAVASDGKAGLLGSDLRSAGRK